MSTHTKQYYAVRTVVRFIFWSALLIGTFTGAMEVSHYLDRHTKLVHCHQADLGWECDTTWK